MPKSAMLDRAARRVVALSEEKLVYDCNALTDPFSGYFPCNYCTTLLRNEADRSRHVILSPACLEAHRQAIKRKPIILPEPDPEDHRSHHSSPTDLPHILAPKPMVSQPSEQQTIPNPPLSPNQPDPETTPADAPELRHSSIKVFVEHPRALPNDGAYIELFPSQLAGAPISADKTYLPDPQEYLASCGTLGDPDYFEIAELLMRPGITNAVRNSLLKSKLYRGRTPWPNCQRMLADIDKLPHGPEWDLHTIITKRGNEERKNYLYGRNIIDIVRELIGNRRFRHYMRFAPERHYTSKDRKSRVYGEMWTGNWWWRYQIILSRINPKATIAPLIIASDKTSVSLMSGGQEVYPVYATIGNISKSIRRKASERATILLGYLPVDKFEEVQSDSERARLRAELTHRAMEVLMAPLRAASKEGMDMWCADGRLRRVYPILAAFVGDWPEQNEMACTSQGGCPICTTAHKGRGDLNQRAPLRKASETLAAIRSYFHYGRHLGELEDLNLKPWMPWWADLPYTNFHACITPDLLHQLHQGLFKSHILTWVYASIGPIMADTRFSAMPHAQGMRHFAKRVSKIRQWTGRESKELMKQILPVIVGSAASADFVELVRSALDFMYRAHSARMDDDDLAELEGSLAAFHRLKEVIVESGLYQRMERFDDVPKIHMLSHYAHSIRELGTPDGFNSESPENLHIMYAKKPWRASNKVKPKPQMLKLIQRQEALRIHRTYLEDCFGPLSNAEEGDGEDEEEDDEEDCDEEDCDEERVLEGIAIGTGEGQQEGDGGSGARSVVEGISRVMLGDEGDADLVGDNGDHVDSHEGNEAEGASAMPEPNYPAVDVTSAKRSTCEVKGLTMGKSYGADEFVSALSNCLSSRLDVSDANGLISPHHSFPVWHKVYLRHPPLTFAPGEPPQRDVVRAHPSSTGNASGGQFDTVLFIDRPDKFGVERYRAGRVRVIFQLPRHLREAHPMKFVYLELFKVFPASPSPFHRMPTTAPQFRYNGKRHTIVLPLTDVVMSCHLAPQFKWLSSEIDLRSSPDLLSLSPRLFLNPYYNYYTFLLLDHWRRIRARR